MYIHCTDPEWNEMMIMNVPDPSKRLRMKCFDSDAGGDKHVVCAWARQAQFERELFENAI